MGTIRELIDQAQLESTVKAARKEIEGWRDTQFWKIISKALDEQAKEIKRLQAWAEHVEEVGNQLCAEKNAELEKWKTEYNRLWEPARATLETLEYVGGWEWREYREALSEVVYPKYGEGQEL